MAELGKSQGRSANSEVILAVVESLAGRVRARASRKIYETYLGPELATAVINQVIVFDKSGIRGTSKSLIRLPDGIRVSIAECIDRKTSIEPRLQSMNSWVLDALVWWINYQRETHALLDACIAMDSEGQLA